MPIVLQGNRVLEKVPMYYLSVLRKANNSPDFPNAAVHVQASYLQLPVAQVQRDCVHLIIVQALRAGQIVPLPGLSPQPSTPSSKTPFDRQQ